MQANLQNSFIPTVSKTLAILSNIQGAPMAIKANQSERRACFLRRNTIPYVISAIPIKLKTSVDAYKIVIGGGARCCMNAFWIIAESTIRLMNCINPTKTNNTTRMLISAIMYIAFPAKIFVLDAGLNINIPVLTKKMTAITKNPIVKISKELLPIIGAFVSIPEPLIIA